ncbi:MAG: tripartite tricarboxylate transporter substrate binding protein [Pseudolabrys sp.]|jgi:tripartite-type tricarboxylate transporter receptor subunit TctC
MLRPCRRLLVCGLAFLLTDVAHAQKYPAHPIQVLVANGPGSASDVGTRVVLNKMATLLGQPAVIINRPGAGGGLAAQAIAKAAPDGYLLLMATDSTYTAIPLTNRTLGYDLNSATTIGAIAEIHSTLLVSATLNVKTLDEFIALAKDKPGQLNYSTFEKGSSSQLWLNWFFKRMGLELQHIPFKSGPELVTAVATGDAAVTTSSLPSSQGYIDAGKLIPVMLTSPSLKSRFPNLPLLSDVIPDPIEPNTTMVLFGPPSLPSDILNRLSRELLRAQASSDVREGLAKIGLASPVPATPEEEKRRMERKFKEYTVLLDSSR